MDDGSEHSWNVISSESDDGLEDDNVPLLQANGGSLSDADVHAAASGNDVTSLPSGKSTPSSPGSEKSPSETISLTPPGLDKSRPTALNPLNLGQASPPQSESPRSWVKEGSHADSEGLHQWQDTHRLATDIREACGGLPRIRNPTTSRHFNVLLAGAPFTGKSTLRSNFTTLLASGPFAGHDETACDKYSAEIHSPEFAQPGKSHTWYGDEGELEDLLTTVTVKDGPDAVPFVFTLQDTPGVEDDDDLEHIISAIKDRLEKHFKVEQDPEREGPMTDYPDGRFDVCLYFLGPNELKQEDNENMGRLSEFVPVIPLLAKVDTMLPKEVEAVTVDLQEIADVYNKMYGREVVYKFPQEVLEAAGPMNPRIVPPFTVMGSTVLDPSVGTVWPIREYAWGTVETFSSRDSDVLLLKKLVFHEGFEPLKRETEKRYYAFRKSKLLAVKDKVVRKDAKLEKTKAVESNSQLSTQDLTDMAALFPVPSKANDAPPDCTPRPISDSPSKPAAPIGETPPPLPATSDFGRLLEKYPPRREGVRGSPLATSADAEADWREATARAESLRAAAARAEATWAEASADAERAFADAARAEATRRSHAYKAAGFSPAGVSARQEFSMWEEALTERAAEADAARRGQAYKAAGFPPAGHNVV